jgi:hypothetical protein
MKTLLALLITSYSFAQCKFAIETYDKMNGNYVVQTQSKVIEGSLLSMAGTEVSLSKVYNAKDTTYLLIISKIQKYETLDNGLPIRRIRKGSTATLLLAGEERIEIMTLQDILETKQSKRIGTSGMRQEHTQKFRALFYLSREHVQLLLDKSLIAIRVNMEDELGNPTSQDINVREKSMDEISGLLKCLIPRFFSK